MKRATATVCAFLLTGSGGQDLEHADHVSRSGRERERTHALPQAKTTCSSGRKPFVCFHTCVEQDKNKAIKVCKQCLGAALTDKQAGKRVEKSKDLAVKLLSSSLV